MIIGTGMLANAFKSYACDKNIIIFASGVSNSKEKNTQNYQREEDLLIKTIEQFQNKTIIYFSTSSIQDTSLQDSTYIQHKTKMENLIKVKCNQYHIFRLSQVVGEANSPTLVNFLIHSIKNDKHMIIQKNATRNLIDVDDVFTICSKIINYKKYINETINIASPFNVKVIKIVNILEGYLNKQAKFEFVNQGSPQHINIDQIIFISKGIFKKEYLNNILLKRIQSI